MGMRSETRSLPTSVTDLKKPYRIHDKAALDLRLVVRWYDELVVASVPNWY